MKRLDDILNGKEENYIFPFFWLHGEEEVVLREYMQVIYNANIRAVCIESRPHPDFCGSKWWADMDIILEEAKRLGMKVWILDDSHFPTGFANGAIESAPMELHHQYLVYRSLEMYGPAKYLEIDINQYQKPAEDSMWKPGTGLSEKCYRDEQLIAVLACPQLEGKCLGKAVDLTDKIENGILRFDLPSGYWKIFVIFLTRNADGRNNYINFMDEESCRLLLDAVYEPHYAHYKEYFGTVIAGFFSDEPPIGNVAGYIPCGKIGNPQQILPWSRYAAERLTEEFGTDKWKLNLPFLWADATDKDVQAKIRNAYMNMVTRLTSECFSKQNGEWCEKRGVEYIGHMLEDGVGNADLGASMGHFFRGLSGQHMSGIDNIGGGVLVNGQNVVRPGEGANDETGFYHYLLGKLGASNAAIDAKKQGRCMCENFGAYGWQIRMQEMKYLTDHFMVRGVNRFVPHAFSPKEFPDEDCPPHFYAHGENPLYHAFGELMAYTNRVCHLIDGGKSCPDVALLYFAEGRWSGDGLSSFQEARKLTQAQIDFHVIPSDVFAKESEYVTTFDGRVLSINGITYGALIIPGCNYLETHVAAFVSEALELGYPIFFTEFLPQGIIGGTDDENIDFQKVMRGFRPTKRQTLSESVKTVVKPEVILLDQQFSNLTVYHYQNDGDAYLLLNEEVDQSFEGQVQVKIHGKKAFRYNPWENKILEVDTKENAEGTVASISIEPLELCVLLFVDSALNLPIEKIQKSTLEDTTEITSFYVTKVLAREYHNRRKVKKQEEVAPFDGMQKKNPHFSGYYVYEREVELELGREYWLEIEDVSDSVEVFVNDSSMGIRLQKPFCFKISNGDLSGENHIRIEVATTLERQLYRAGHDVKSMSAYRPLSPTGIIGRVQLRKYTTEKGGMRYE